jgi:hypothetical protein
VVTADFTGDGNLDLAVANGPSNNVSVFVGNGDGTFQPAQNFATGTYPFGYIIGVGDFNGDGSPDLATANSGSNNVSVLINANDWAPGPHIANFGTDMSGRPAVLAPSFRTAAPGNEVRTELLADPVARPAGSLTTPQRVTAEGGQVVPAEGFDLLSGDLAISPLANGLWSWAN